MTFPTRSVSRGDRSPFARRYPAVSRRIAIVLKGYPRLSETFIAQEIRALELRGFELRLISLRHPTDRAHHPVHDEIEAPVRYLPEYLHHEPLRVMRALLAVRGLPGFADAAFTWWRDFRRDPSRSRVRRFGQALVLAAELESDVVHLHAHFLHTPSSVARYAAVILGMQWSFSAHAKDIWTIGDWEKREKLAAARFGVTCTRHNAEHLAGLSEHAVDLVYHGVDLERFDSPPPGNARPRDGSRAEEPVRLLSVGRAVEKKGYDVLLEALARLPSELSWRLEHIGGGPLLAKFERQAKRLGIAERVRFLGAQPQDRVLDRYRNADLFVLSNRIARDGDRDGLPNVLMEAQSQRLACIASDVSAACELIRDGETGVLVPAEDVAALTEALRALIVDGDLRARLGRAAEDTVRAHFSMHANIERLVERLGTVARAA